MKAVSYTHLGILAITLPMLNMGEVLNQGYELSLKWADGYKDMRYWIGARVAPQSGQVFRDNDSYTPCFDLDQHTPVSYTHLDVYKRQPHTTFLIDDCDNRSFLCDNITPPSVNHAQSRGSFCSDNRGSWWWAHCRACLLYTSRCV